MYFIYPASVSENCDKRIIPAVAKAIERFFLLQLQDAMASGVISLSRKWNGSNYGSLLLESLLNYNKKQYLTENRILLEARGGGGGGRGGRDHGPSPQFEEYRHRLNAITFNSQMEDEEIETLTAQVDRIEDEIRGDHTISAKEQKDLQSICKAIRSRLETILKISDRNKDKETTHVAGGSYIPMQTKVDILPTSGVVNVNVLYKGGHENGNLHKYVDVNINVKVIPTIIKNFKSLEHDLLNDYFTRKSESYFTSIGRNIARKSYNALKSLPFGMGDFIWKKGMEYATGEDMDSESRQDIIYQTQGFVNASAFHKSGSSPNNYNYTSNIVIFNKDDLTDPDDQNIFANRSAMVRLFKMGWSTFCMLDPVEEVMYFISSLDGGYMHIIPYRYIMESYGSKAYYGDDKKLKDSAKPFLIKRGGFSDFAKMFRKK